MRVIKISLFFISLLATGLNAQELKASFEINNFGLPVDGVFHETKVEYRFDSESLSTSYFQAQIPVKSIDTNIKARDRHLLEEKYFHEEKYSQMVFKSTAVYLEGEQIMLRGNLTIKGISQEVVSPIQIERKDGEIVALRTSFELNRRDFKVGKGSLVLGNEVEVKLELLLKD